MNDLLIKVAFYVGRTGYPKCDPQFIQDISTAVKNAAPEDDEEHIVQSKVAERLRGFADYYKNWVAFELQEGICYVPELSDTMYTYKDFFLMCGGDEQLTKEVFELCEWQHPETVLDEMKNDEKE